jgi:hypothetical protein
MRRRDFIWILGSGIAAIEIGCDDTLIKPSSPGETPDAAAEDPLDATQTADACTQAVVRMHDTYAQALYLDNSLGPLTGVVEVDFVLAGASITLEFWHGHGGQQHRFTLEPAHFEALKRGERVTLGTTTVDGHAHTLFVDPRDEDYRVPGAPDVDVPLGRCEG